MRSEGVLLSECPDDLANEGRPRFNGKTKRFLTGFLPVDPRRTGECTRCGACCKFVVTCPFLRYTDADPNSARCIAYAIRPLQCRKYPRSRAEQIHQPCGFRFEDEEK